MKTTPAPIQPPTTFTKILAITARIYARDRVRFRKLVIWIHSARKAQWSDERIYKALLALNKREEAGATVAEWWPWLTAALRKIRTMELQAESEAYKHGDANSIKAILKQIFRGMK